MNQLFAVTPAVHAPRILLLYGSLRERSYSILLTLEASRLLEAMGAEVKVFDPAGLPQPDGVPDNHPRVQALRNAVVWAEGMVWTSPERHGAMTSILKSQIDWLPLTLGAVRPTQGKDAGTHASEWWISVIQCCESNAYPGALDAHDHHPQSILRCESILGV